MTQMLGTSTRLLMWVGTWRRAVTSACSEMMVTMASGGFKTRSTNIKNKESMHATRPRRQITLHMSRYRHCTNLYYNKKNISSIGPILYDRSTFLTGPFVLEVGSSCIEEHRTKKFLRVPRSAEGIGKALRTFVPNLEFFSTL